ncbi:MAG: hypothetical protein AAF998_11475 [Bacteroidota bacterium]
MNTQRKIILVIALLLVVFSFCSAQTTKTHTEYWDNGKTILKLKYQYIEGEKATVGTIKYREDGILTGMEAGGQSFAQRILHGKYLSYYENGILEIEATYQTGYLHGVKKEFHSNGKLKYLKKYDNGALNGTYEAYSESGVLLERMKFKDHMLTDSSFTYFGDGKVEKLILVTGNEGPLILIGKIINFYPDGKIDSEGEAKIKGQGLNIKIENSGLWVYYNESGQKVAEEEYGYDKTLARTYYDNGQLKESGQINYDKWDGPHKSFYEDGGLYSEGTYKSIPAKDPIRIGEWKIYHRNGQVFEWAKYSDFEDNRDVCLLEYKKYNEGGNLQIHKKFSPYEGGKLILLKEYDEEGNLIKEERY